MTEKNIEFYSLLDIKQITWAPQDSKKSHQCLEASLENKSVSSAAHALKKDQNYVKEFSRNNYQRTASEIRCELTKDGYITTFKNIDNELTKVRSEKYPQDTSKAFSNENCLTIDQEQNLLR